MHIPRSCYFLWALPLMGILLIGGCKQGGNTADGEGVKIDLTLRPDPPRVGEAAATVRLTAKDGTPIQGAKVRLEGNMNHAGMKPVFADGNETEAGIYAASLELTMGGDWFILVNVTLADGRKLSRKVDVLGVRSK